MWYMYIYEITLYGMKRLEQFIFYFRVLVQLKLIFILMYEKKYLHIYNIYVWMHNIQNNHVVDSVDGAKMYLTSTVTVIYNMHAASLWYHVKIQYLISYML